jgi:hypothetical protein
LTYDDLLANTPNWLYARNKDITSVMETVVQQAHDQIINLIDHDLFRTVIGGKVLEAANYGVLDLSAETPRVLEVRGMRLKYKGEDSYTPIQRRDLEMLTMLYARNRPRVPLYYSEYSGTLVLKAFPAPKEDMDLEITANVEPLVLSPTNQTNIISIQAPRVLEKATFRQGALYMKDWQSADAYEKELGVAIQEINAAIQRRRRDETEIRPADASNVSGA